MTDITLKMVPVGQYEYVDVEFPSANTDTVVKYGNLKLDDLQKVRWIDISPGSARVVKSPTTSFGPGYVVLQSTVANYRTRLLLFTERKQSNA